MTEDEFEPPEDTDPVGNPSILDGLETELPESEELPPEEVQARLEAPTSFYQPDESTGSGGGILEVDAITEPGVKKRWTEPDPDEMKKASDGTAAGDQVVSSTGDSS